MVVRDLWVTMRPKQWTKNVFVFAGIVFARELFLWSALVKTLVAFFLFCLVSSAVYLINDVVDRERDRMHPVKCKRPLASGRLRPAPAIVTAVVLAGLSLPLGFLLNIPFERTINLPFGLSLTGYFLLMLGYSFFLKNIVILDVFAIAAGFVLRAVGGAVAIPVFISPWLLVCTVLLSLFLGLAKRRHELVLLNNNATEHRGILREYSPALLEEMISVVTACTVMAYSLYTFYPFFAHGQEEKTSYPYMMFTIPFVIYAIFRYLYLVYQKEGGGSPEEVLLGDVPFLVNILLWGVCVLVILYFDQIRAAMGWIAR
ncbi:MAG: decaprenyl-phosphate phosphoribosyltransferase [Chloroflexia bacterium]